MSFAGLKINPERPMSQFSDVQHQLSQGSPGFSIKGGATSIVHTKKNTNDDLSPIRFTGSNQAAKHGKEK